MIWWRMALLAALCGEAAAAEPSPSPEPVGELGLFHLEEVLKIESAASTKLEQPVREAPAAMSVTTRDHVESYGWITLNDILYRQPGFAPSQDYDRRTVAARGMFEGWNNNHLLLLVDGVPHNDNLYGSAFTWEITPLGFAQRIDVIRGPGSALYGSNATNGVIAIETRTPSSIDPPIEGQLRVGNANTQIYDVWAGHAWRNVTLSLAYNHYTTDGNAYESYDGSGRANPDGTPRKFPVGDARKSDYVFFKLTLPFGLSAQFHYQYWRFQTGHGWIWFIPDESESMAENRQIASLAWRPPPSWSGRFRQEYVLQYQRHAVDWRMKFYPNGSTVGGIDYPNGVRERLDTAAHSVFTRLQWTVKLWREMSLLAGLENTLFYYGGDRTHSANADLSGTRQPFLDERPLRSWFEWVRRKPVDNLGAYLQYASGRIFRRVVSLTAGLRYDVELFDYVDLTQPMRPTLSKMFSQLSPRVGLVVFPWRELALKLMVDRAFRAPAPAELFGANTLTLASNLKQLKPEEITAVTFAVDAGITTHLNLRANWFYTIFENQIAYSLSNANLSTNLYSRTLTGVEAELMFDYPLGRAGWLGGFGNYTFAHLVDEKITDPTIAASTLLTWAPAHVFNFGLNFVGHGFNASLQGHFQGRVERRSSDTRLADGTLSPNAGLRGTSVSPWFTLDARVSYRFAGWVRLGVQVMNLLDTRGALIKNNDYPFDYQIEGIRVLGTLELEIRNLPL